MSLTIPRVERKKTDTDSATCVQDGLLLLPQRLLQYTTGTLAKDGNGASKRQAIPPATTDGPRAHFCRTSHSSTRSMLVCRNADMGTTTHGLSMM